MSDPAKRGLTRGLILCGVLIVAVAVFLIWPNASETNNAVASYENAIGGPFTLTDQNGRTVTDRTLRGKPFAIFFGFTRCPDVCPTTMQRMAQLRKGLGSDGNKFAIVFVSIDPGHDKREDIASFLSMFDTPVIGLTGTQAQLEAIQRAYKVYVAKVPLEGEDYTVDHTATVFLMGKRGEFVSAIDMHEQDDIAVLKLRRIINS